ncbi:GntR family transcriptional regulator [Heliomarina baculiformis]|uniref:GntR family transcriptional regulator n=1 Tax=Heliomarina baculiformis TaxID=2872036 RepID=UPI001EE30BBD|nr:GntR family transcriptional regulator [Heliomarina baculiformis]
MLKTSEERLALNAYEQILQMVLSGEAAHGQMINERRLADMLGISRTPVRDALLMLEAEGLLVRQGTRGLQIRQMRIEEYMDALHIRQILEPEVARLAQGRISREDLQAIRDQLVELVASRPSTGERPDREKVRAVDDLLHGSLAEAAGNPQLADIIRTVRRRTQIFDLRSIPQRFDETCAEHLAIIDALMEGDAQKASEAMRNHLDNVQGSILQTLASR